MRWRIEFFEDAKGVQPVREWLESLPNGVRIKLEALIDLLADHGPTLDYPYSSQIEGKLRELRERFGADPLQNIVFLRSE